MAGRNLLAPVAQEAPKKGRNLLEGVTAVSPGQAQADLERQRSEGSQNEPGFLQQMFDIQNPSTGESYLYGNTPPQAPYEDLQRTVADTVSRGYLDKLRGPEAQAQTAAARERMPDWAEIPTDIGAAVASSPYRIGSMGAGALYGGLEGAASAYGHQEGWVPGWDVLKGAGEGAAFGAGGAKLGEWGGKLWDNLSNTAPRPAPVPTGPPRVGRVGSAVQSFGNLPRSTTVPIDAVLSMLHMPPVVTGASTVAEQAGKLFKPRLPPAARPPEPAIAAAARDALAKMLIGYGRSP